MINNKMNMIFPKDRIKHFRAAMESLNIIHGFVLITIVCGIIVTNSILMYLRSDRSKYDLYRPGQDKPQEVTAENAVNVDRTEDKPVYRDELNDVIVEIDGVISSQQDEQAFKAKDLDDQNLIRPELNLNP
jgi:hypothetical protein